MGEIHAYMNIRETVSEYRLIGVCVHVNERIHIITKHLSVRY